MPLSVAELSDRLQPAAALLWPPAETQSNSPSPNLPPAFVFATRQSPKRLWAMTKMRWRRPGVAKPSPTAALRDILGDDGDDGAVWSKTKMQPPVAIEICPLLPAAFADVD